MKLLEKYANLPEAYLVKGMLESNGIPVVVQADALAQIFPGPAGGGMGFISLYVPEDDLDVARQLISNHKS